MSLSYTKDDLHLLGRYRVRLNEAGRLASTMPVPPEDKVRFRNRFEAMQDALRMVQNIDKYGGHRLAAVARTLNEAFVPEGDTMRLEQPFPCEDILWHWEHQKMLAQDSLEGTGCHRTGPKVEGSVLHYIFPFDKDLRRPEREQVEVTGWLLDTRTRRAYCFTTTMDDAAFGCQELFHAIASMGGVKQVQEAVQAFLAYSEALPPITNDMF